MATKETKLPFTVPHGTMSSHEWNLRFRKYAHTYREFNIDGPSLLDLVYPPKNQTQPRPRSTSLQDEDHLGE